ncbi:MAG: Jag N-terminal domain-containing protein [Clostridia bacterium]|nr:Jag N-terminal domain-containing protein [Clostridia bacterium]MBQ8792078.1 Jag N-terminal domain-containing protein [Clostridia bacterium]
MLSVEGIGKNIEQAIENALFELKAPREDVDIKILNEGGLFKKAKVLVSISEDCKAKYEKKTEKKEAKPEPVKQEKEEPVIVKPVEEVKEQEVAIEDEEEEKIDLSVNPKEFLEGFLNVAGKEGCEIVVTEDDKYVTYAVNGENLGDLIGHRGEGYYALSKILSAVAGKKGKRVLLDIGGYRAKRIESLTSLAIRTANKVAKTGRYARLDPMNPADRRIIHSALQNDGRVSTLSKGEEPKRYVMIFPTDAE